MEPDFVPPGPGQWALDRSHYPGGTTPISQWLISESSSAGFKRVFAELGLPAESLDARFVNGFFYTRLRPLINPDKPPKRLPPLFVLRIASRVHPLFRARSKAAAKTFRDRPSNEVAKRWEQETKPRIRAANLAFQKVDPQSVDDRELQRHISDLLDHLRENFELHFWLHGHDLGPIARFLHSCIQWGIEPQEAIESLAGASPATSQPLKVLSRIRSLMDSADTPLTSLDDIRGISAEAASLLDRYMADRGHMLVTGYDITAFTLVELPNVVLDSIRSAEVRPEIDAVPLAEALRAQVPADDRSVFDERLSDARAVMNMRDDNGPTTTEWPAGLLRRALLAAGQRLAERGELSDPLHALEVSPEEARALFSGGSPSASVLEERAAARAAMAKLTPPLTLGEEEPEPPLDVLPKELAEMVAMVTVALEHLGLDGVEASDEFAGAGIGAESYVGRARVAESASEAIEKMEDGDVLVVRATSPAFNAVLSIAGAIVTADGGALSHAAVMAREMGIPAVIGATGALSIPDGTMIEVDPLAGAVRIE